MIRYILIKCLMPLFCPYKQKKQKQTKKHKKQQMSNMYSFTSFEREFNNKLAVRSLEKVIEITA